MTRKRCRKLLMSYGIPRNVADAMAKVQRWRYGRYDFAQIPGDDLGMLSLAVQLAEIEFVPTITHGLLAIQAMGLHPPGRPRAK